ncbi:hypothetical protein BRD13_04070 [Halobacteriales archaeon SW_5_70_135]|nr:MAG: hypothetical protein BRD13_04070 [Halobacteriales archaeon SW_5_70_135]
MPTADLSGPALGTLGGSRGVGRRGRPVAPRLAGCTLNAEGVRASVAGIATNDCSTARQARRRSVDGDRPHTPGRTESRAGVSTVVYARL